jgi:osmotically-inducible protein OsmY
MKNIVIKLRLIGFVVVSSLFLSACFGVPQIASTLYSAASISNDRRTLGTIWDDKATTFRLANWSGNDKKLADTHLNFMSYDRTILVTGEAPTQAVRDYISAQIKLKFPRLKKLFNEMKIAPNEGLLSRAKDVSITAQVETLLFGQEVFYPSHVRVMTENNVVYLMGALTKREANMAARTAARASGVVRVVKIFDYLVKRPIEEIERDKRQAFEQKQALEMEEKRTKIEAQKKELRAKIRALDAQIKPLEEDF